MAYATAQVNCCHNGMGRENRRSDVTYSARRLPQIFPVLNTTWNHPFWDATDHRWTDAKT